MSETEADIANAEAWSEIIEDLLTLVPPDKRMEVLQLALANEKAEMVERAKNDGLRVVQYSETNLAHSLRHWNVKMRLKSLIIQVFTRNIRNNHSPEDAAKILFAKHPYGRGSRVLRDYLPQEPAEEWEPI